MQNWCVGRGRVWNTGLVKMKTNNVAGRGAKRDELSLMIGCCGPVQRTRRDREERMKGPGPGSRRLVFCFFLSFPGVVRGARAEARSSSLPYKGYSLNSIPAVKKFCPWRLFLPRRFRRAVNLGNVTPTKSTKSLREKRTCSRPIETLNVVNWSRFVVRIDEEDPLHRLLSALRD